MSANAQLKVVADGSVGIGTSTPGKKLEVVGQMQVNNLTTYPTAKQSTITMRHYSDAATDFAFFKAQSSQTQNSVNFGGGAGANYAATSVVFFTAGNTTTTNGTERMRVRGDGRIRVGSSGVISHLLSVNGDAAKPGGGDWATLSDSRVKKDIRDFDGGLAEVMRINPVYFTYKEGIDANEGKEYVGILAQDMQKVAPYTVEEKEVTYEEGEERTIELDKVLTYDGTAVRYMLVNAVKEQQAQIEEKDAQINEIMQKLEALTEQVAKLQGNKTDVTLENQTLETVSSATLAQNTPNPFNESTVISYNVPETATKAMINIIDQRGGVLKTVEVERGEGQLNLEATALPSGTYHYQLMVDGEVIDTKSMILAK